MWEARCNHPLCELMVRWLCSKADLSYMQCKYSNLTKKKSTHILPREAVLLTRPKWIHKQCKLRTIKFKHQVILSWLKLHGTISSALFLCTNKFHDEAEKKPLLTLRPRLLFCFSGSTMLRNFLENSRVFLSKFLGGTVNLCAHSLRNSSRLRKSTSWVSGASAAQEKLCDDQLWQQNFNQTNRSDCIHLQTSSGKEDNGTGPYKLIPLLSQSNLL